MIDTTHLEIDMKYILIAFTLLLVACDKPETPKIAESQREALDKANKVEQMMLDSANAMKQKVKDETE